jgi:predicted acetyltransferase
MTIDFRRTRPDERRAAADVFRTALLFPPSSDADWARPDIVESWADALSISAWDGALCVGHAGAFRFHTAVPGGARLSTAGVTRVGVRQTHTRRGVLTTSMQQLLTDARDEGMPLASLRASEATIYSRFGFAVAGDAWDIEIDRRSGARVVVPVADGTTRILDRADTLETVAAMHDRVGFDRPGTISRPLWLHGRYLKDALENEKATFVIVHANADGVDVGWALYTLAWIDSSVEHAGGTCEVQDVWGESPAVELALWKFILDLDLIDVVKASERPLDDAVRFGLRNERHYRSVRRNDEQWLRLLDVDAALSARTYNAAAATVTIEVHDSLFQANCGTWTISAEGARQQTTNHGPADLSTTINGISAAYLGGTAWHDLGVAGVVQERRRGSLATADVLFASRPLPRCGTFF